jgi:hypothetical protein
MRAPGRRRDTLAADAIDRGRYATQLARLQRFYDPDRILVLQYERCRDDPAGGYRRVLRFLGVDEDHEPQSVERARGTNTASVKQDLWPDLVEALQRFLEPDVERLAEMVPDLDLALWPHFAHLAGRTPAHG